MINKTQKYKRGDWVTLKKHVTWNMAMDKYDGATVKIEAVECGSIKFRGSEGFIFISDCYSLASRIELSKVWYSGGTRFEKPATKKKAKPKDVWCDKFEVGDIVVIDNLRRPRPDQTMPFYGKIGHIGAVTITTGDWIQLEPTCEGGSWLASNLRHASAEEKADFEQSKLSDKKVFTPAKPKPSSEKMESVEPIRIVYPYSSSKRERAGIRVVSTQIIK